MDPDAIVPPPSWFRCHWKTLLALGAAMVAASVGLYFTSRTTPEGHLEQAALLEQKAEYRAVTIELKNALERLPLRPDIHFRLGRALYFLGDHAGSEKELLKARELGHNDPDLTIFLARAQLALRQGAEVIQQTENLAGATLDQKLALLALRARAQAMGEDLAGAEETLAGADQWARDHPETLFVRALLAQAQGDLQGARRLLDQALSRPGIRADLLGPDLWALKGDISQALGQSAAAVEAYAKALVLSPGSVPIRVSSIRAHLSAGALDQAEKDLGVLRTRDPSNMNGQYLEAMLLYLRGRHADAYAKAQQVLRVAPAYTPAMLLVAASGMALNKREEARTQLNRVLEAESNHAGARKMLAALQLKQGDLEAARHLMSTLGDDPKDISLAAMRGDIALLQGDFQEARRNLEILTESGKRPEAALKLAASQAGLGDRSAALKTLTDLARKDKDSARADFLLITEFLKEKRFEDALLAADQLAAKAKDPALVENVRGIIQVTRQDAGKARAHFTAALKANPKFIPALTNLATLEMEQHRYEQAKVLLLRAVDLDATDLNIRLDLARIASLRGAREEFREHLERAKQIDPKAMEPRLRLVRFWQDQGNLGRALTEAHEGYGLTGDADFAHHIVMIQLRQNDLAGAESFLHRWLQGQPESPQALTGLALVRMGQDNFAEAMQHLDQALAIRPDYLPAQNARMALMAQGQSRIDVATLAREIEIPRAAKEAALVKQAEALLAEKRRVEAAGILEEAARASGQTRHLARAYQALEQAGQPASGMAMLSRWLAGHGDDANVRHLLALAGLKQGKLKEAAEHYRVLLRSRPMDPVALNNLAWALGELKDPGAPAAAERAYKASPEDPSSLDTYAWVLYRSGKPKSALPLLQKAHEKAPGNPGIHWHFAAALAAAGEPDRAKAELERLLSAGKPFNGEAEARKLLGELRR